MPDTIIITKKDYNRRIKGALLMALKRKNLKHTEKKNGDIFIFGAGRYQEEEIYQLLDALNRRLH